MAPLMEMFAKYFDERAISWFKDENGKLDLIIVVCYGAKFSYKNDEEYAYMKYLLESLSSKVEDFFKQFGTKATISDLMEPVPNTFIEYTKIAAMTKIEHKTLKSVNLFREIHHPLKKYDYLIFRYKEKGKAIEEAKKLFKDLVEKGITKVRINPEHPNIIEIKDEKTDEWKPIFALIDLTNQYTPKGEKKRM